MTRIDQIGKAPHGFGPTIPADKRNSPAQRQELALRTGDTQPRLCSRLPGEGGPSRDGRHSSPDHFSAHGLPIGREEVGIDRRQNRLASIRSHARYTFAATVPIFAPAGLKHPEAEVTATSGRSLHEVDRPWST